MNSLQGIKNFFIGDKEYKLKFTTNSIVEMYEDTGLDIKTTLYSSDAIGEMFKSARILLFYGLKHFHKTENYTIDDMGNLVDELGIELALTHCLEAWKIALPNVDRNKEDKNTEVKKNQS